jgi:hypothetical protein
MVYSALILFPTFFHGTFVGILRINVPGSSPAVTSLRPADDLEAISIAFLSLLVNPSSPLASTMMAVGFVEFAARNALAWMVNNTARTIRRCLCDMRETMMIVAGRHCGRKAFRKMAALTKERRGISQRRLRTLPAAWQ